jgi:hypothetical protein
MEDGGPVPYDAVEADAHGNVYWEVVKGDIGSGTWDVRFAVGKDGAVAYQKC